MTTVYAVSSGEYSDYRPIVFFATRALAERHFTEVQSDEDSWYSDAFVEEFEYLDRAPKRVKEHSIQACVKDGAVFGPWMRQDTEPTLDTREVWEYSLESSRRPHVRIWQAPASGTGWNLRVVGTSKAAVLKAYSDRLTKLVAGEVGEVDA